ncbi:MAG: hypothetical protein M9913_01950 [Bryobacteraceae bacterium]|nr:hypothetical protein [Solibacteraceae bacterium]MCL4840246.1 hypothetical protein [Bryobacteraceae bacterium]MCO5349666.1 hypothetical protein [Bryobacteraceae bacterium]HAX43211.1 hypothetical protein [Bryobacterales bacterium]HRJ18312.1 hypothetical protein [Bryobacteraceae bacterium]
MKRLFLALILIVPTFGAATLPDTAMFNNPWPDCLPCPPPTPPPEPPPDSTSAVPDSLPVPSAIR